MIIFAVESSCDETSAAVIQADTDGIHILSNVVATQIETHALYGGVVPEIASRAHLEAISAVAEKALADAGSGEISAVAVTCAPGLIGALLVGVSFAKAFAFAKGIPLIPVNHIKAHAAAVYPSNPDLKPPYFAVVVSGSHTSVYRVTDYTTFVEIGGSRDDAAGEAFDKVGRRLGLSYPCGAAMDRLARLGMDADTPAKYSLPSPHIKGSADFSFSGLKTAAVNLIHGECQKRGIDDGAELPDEIRSQIAAAFTNSVTSGICSGLESAFAEYAPAPIVLAGGVAANSHLRSAISVFAENHGVSFLSPPPSLCGDNAAMIGIQGYFEYMAGVRAGCDLNAYASEEAAAADGIFDTMTSAENGLIRQ